MTSLGAVVRSVKSAPLTSLLSQGYGQRVFKGAVAAPYLSKHSLPTNTLENPAWASNGSADKVAAAVLDWARDNGANTFCHWFQPLGASAFRHGLSAQVHVAMVEFNAAGEPVWDFSGKKLLKGRRTAQAFLMEDFGQPTPPAYLSVDPTSPVFLRGDTIFIPSTMVSYHGHALDEKTPLLRASDALSRGHSPPFVTRHAGRQGSARGHRPRAGVLPRSAWCLPAPPRPPNGRTNGDGQTASAAGTELSSRKCK